MSKEPCQGLLPCRERTMLVAPGAERNRWRSQAWVEVPRAVGTAGPAWPSGTAAKHSLSSAPTALLDGFLDGAGNTRQTALMCCFSEAAFLQEHTVNVNDEHTVLL